MMDNGIISLWLGLLGLFIIFCGIIILVLRFIVKGKEDFFKFHDHIPPKIIDKEKGVGNGDGLRLR